MYNNIIGIMSEIDEKCPLLVETPAGQGTEICTKIECFMNFYELFTDEEKRKVKFVLMYVIYLQVVTNQLNTLWIGILNIQKV